LRLLADSKICAQGLVKPWSGMYKRAKFRDRHLFDPAIFGC